MTQRQVQPGPLAEFLKIDAAGQVVTMLEADVRAIVSPGARIGAGLPLSGAAPVPVAQVPVVAVQVPGIPLRRAGYAGLDRFHDDDLAHRPLIRPARPLRLIFCGVSGVSTQEMYASRLRECRRMNSCLVASSPSKTGSQSRLCPNSSAKRSASERSFGAKLAVQYVSEC